MSERLVPIGRQLTGPFRADWLSYFPERLGGLMVDILLAINSLAHLGWSQSCISLRSIGYSRKSNCWMLNEFVHAQAIYPSDEAIQSDLNDLAVTITSIIDNSVRDVLSGEPWLTRKLDELVAVAELLKNRPTLLMALEATLSFYKHHRNCSKMTLLSPTLCCYRAASSNESQHPSILYRRRCRCGHPRS